MNLNENVTGNFSFISFLLKMENELVIPPNTKSTDILTLIEAYFIQHQISRNLSSEQMTHIANLAIKLEQKNLIN